MAWRFRPFDADLAARLAESLSRPMKVGEFLAARGFKDADEVQRFVGADLKDLPVPTSLDGVGAAAERLLHALKNDELVAVCGDYDADGLTATALLTRGLRQLGQRVISKIPHRLSDGYGLKPKTIEELAAQGVRVVVTVDNGVSDIEAAEKAARLGLDLIITDHHKLPPKLPPALAVVNPHLSPAWNGSPLAGVGVAFMLLASLKRFYQNAGVLAEGEGPSVVETLALVAIGSIADMVPLTGANRILVRRGLQFLSANGHPGLSALKKVCRLDQRPRITPHDVGFMLAPRLNAAGRLGSADPALDLLLAEDAREAERLAVRLDELNRERQQGQNRLCAEALERLEEECDPDDASVVLAGENWPRGLLGLAASRVAENTKKPTLLLSIEGGQATGSGRGAGGVNLYQALDSLRHLFSSFGGHAQAAGLSLPTENLPVLKRGFEEAVREAGPSAEDELHIDVKAGQGELSGLAEALAGLEPFGQGNPGPVAAIMGAKIVDARPTDNGGRQHMKVTVSDGLARQTFVGFNLAKRLHEIGPSMDLALGLESAEVRGPFNPWRLVDFRETS